MYIKAWELILWENLVSSIKTSEKNRHLQLLQTSLEQTRNQFFFSSSWPAIPAAHGTGGAQKHLSPINKLSHCST